jgi:hypothetical protein
MIATRRQSAPLTLMPTLAQSLRHTCPASASLRRAAGVHLDEQPTSLFRFVGQLVDQGRPPGIRYGLGEHSGCQAFDVQIFDHDQAKVANQPPADLVVKIRALIADVRVSGLKLAHGFLPIIAAPFAPRHLALCPPEFRLRPSGVARVLNPGPVRESSEGRQPDIDPDACGGLWQGLGLALNREAGVPLPSLALDRHGLNSAFNRPVQFEFDLPDALEIELPRVEQPAPVAVTREGQAVVTAARPEARKPDLAPALLDAPEESFEVLVQAAQHVLAAGEVGQFEVAGRPNLLQLICLIVVVQRQALDAVSVTALLKRGVVEPAGFSQLPVKRRDLLRRGVEAVAKGFSLFYNWVSQVGRASFASYLVRLDIGIPALCRAVPILAQTWELGEGTLAAHDAKFPCRINSAVPFRKLMGFCYHFRLWMPIPPLW